jgi:hypothetical protein
MKGDYYDRRYDHHQSDTMTDANGGNRRLFWFGAVTSYALSGEEKKARAAGCDDYV